VGAPAASGGGHRGRCAGEVGLCGGRRARWRARVGTREGGSELGLGVQPSGARACRGGRRSAQEPQAAGFIGGGKRGVHRC
jgi:hypothetical protein